MSKTRIVFGAVTVACSVPAEISAFAAVSVAIALFSSVSVGVGVAMFVIVRLGLWLTNRSAR